MAIGSLDVNYRDEFVAYLEELRRGLDELEEAYRRGNAPRMGAALCDMELHVDEGLNFMERKHPYFKPQQFRELVKKQHLRPSSKSST